MNSSEKKRKRLLDLFTVMNSDSDKSNSDHSNDHSDSDYEADSSLNDSDASDNDGNSESLKDNKVDSGNEIWTSTVAGIPSFGFDEKTAGTEINEQSPRQVFDILFCGELLDLLVKSTNETAKMYCIRARRTRYSNTGHFKPTNSLEMIKFIGLCLLQGEIKPAKMRQLFSKQPLYYYPIFPNTMSRRRFEQLIKCLDVNPELENRDLNKVSGFLKLFSEKSQEMNRPKKNLVLDEALLLCQGKLHFKLFTRFNSLHNCIRFHELCDPVGYTYNLEIQREKTNIDDHEYPEVNSLVLQLLSPYLEKGHTLFMDIHYNSITLSKKLLEHKTHTCGVLRSTSNGIPKELVTKNLAKNEYIWLRNGKIYVSKYKKHKEVVYINTAYHPTIMNNTETSHNKTNKMPVEVENYYQNIPDINSRTDIVLYHSCPSKTILWYKQITFAQFRKSLICSLLDKQYMFRESDIEIVVKRPKPYMTLLKNHVMEKISLPENYVRKLYYRDCECCLQQKKINRTPYRCTLCPNKPSLCHQCFNLWHTNSKG